MFILIKYQPVNEWNNSTMQIDDMLFYKIPMNIIGWQPLYGVSAIKNYSEYEAIGNILAPQLFRHSLHIYHWWFCAGFHVIDTTDSERGLVSAHIDAFQKATLLNSIIMSIHLPETTVFRKEEIWPSVTCIFSKGVHRHTLQTNECGLYGLFAMKE